MLIVILRTFIIFITLAIVMRLMGKRQIGEMQPLEFVITLIIAELACIPMADTSIPLLYGIVSVLAIYVVHQLLFLIEQSGNFTKKIISGKPSVVIDENGVDIKELKKNNLDVEDLIESMRAQGYFSLDDVNYAIFEANGKLSALKKDETSSALPVLIISEGKINDKNATAINLTESDILKFLKTNNVNLKKVEVLTIDENGRAYLKIKNLPYKIVSVKKENV